MNQGLVFSDLDGTLLDHEDYGFEPALPALTALKERRVPLVLISSKTAAEMLPIHQKLDLDAPFIVENGGGIYFPSGDASFQVARVGAAYADLEIFLERYVAEHPKLQVTSYSDLTPQALADLTGLPIGDAALSLQREFDLPFVIEPLSALQPLREAARRAGLKLTAGGRFSHLMGLTDKGSAARKVLRHYRQLWGFPPRTLGLGDSRNDIDFLESMEHAVIVPNPNSGAPLANLLPRAKMAPAPGPTGWNRAVLDWLESI